MKKFLTSGILFLIIIGVLYILYLQECERDLIPEGYVLVDEQVWDSITNIDMTSVVIKEIDTLIIKELVYVKVEVPVPVDIVSNITYYQDSIVNDSIRFWEYVWIDGLIKSWEKRYEPVIHLKETIIEIKVPQIVDNEIPVYQRELFLSGVVGGNMNAFSFGVDLDFVNKKRNIYGIQYRRMGNDDFYYFKIGTTLFKN